jgi:hypothetical protein
MPPTSDEDAVLQTETTLCAPVSTVNMNGERMQQHTYLLPAPKSDWQSAKASPDTRWLGTGVLFRLRAFPFAPPLESKTR